ncbi:MAG: rod shape-determining protein RodA [Proteobacteria bacterium]|nr:rod shape-determining protein RodA [Pseudomonadota bacterium]
MKFDRRLLFGFDWVLLFLVLSISLVGVLNLYSAGYSLSDFNGSPLYMKQIYWVLIGLVFMGVCFCVDYHFIGRYAYIIYAVSIILLVLVFFYGSAVHGSQRWIVVGSFSFQPSELAKLTVILALAKYFSDNKVDRSYNLKGLLLPFLIVLVPFLLILKQPDLGTALILAVVFLSMAVFVGIKWSSITLAGIGGIMLIPICWNFLRDYQKGRILALFNPERDPLGSGYHVIQSMIAVGSGGILGKGFLKGTQTQLKFLPEQQTDFVFSVFAEEWGFLGGIVLMVMFLALILWGLRIARYSRDLLGLLIALGVTMLIFGEVFINIGMVLGILPVVGLPLPFLSYGGSSMVVLMAGIGLLMNVSMRRFVLQP